MDGAFFRELMLASFSAGLQAIELTMNTEGCERIVAECLPHVPTGKLLGIGTVRNTEEARRAVDAGGMFLVTPNVDTAVIEYARNHEVPIVAGALTPTEVYTAWAAGADMVKIFPCHAFGPKYLRDLHGPFDDVPLVAVGGIDKANLRDYFDAGAAAVGTSTSLFGRDALAARDLAAIADNVGEFVKLCPCVE